MSSSDYASPDPQIAVFESPDSYIFDGATGISHPWGHYDVKFGITLDDYPDFERQDFEFSLHVVPDCERSLIQALSEIEIDPLVAGLTSTKDFAGYYTHDFVGVYDDYCGPFTYALEPDSCDPLCLSGTVLTLDSASFYAGGRFDYILTVKLGELRDDYSTVELDLPFEVEIIPCTVIGHYADSIDQLVISPS